MGQFYLNDHNNLLNFFLGLLNHLLELEKPTSAKHSVCGDYNFTIEKKNDQSENLVERLNLFDLTLKSSLNATRKTELSESTIDQVFTNFEGEVLVKKTYITDNNTLL